jgi:hypothetical protein
MNNYRDRYKAAYNKWQLTEYPAATASYGPLPPKFPDVKTHNGLRRFVIDFLKFEGHYSNAISTTGRKIWSAKRNKEIWINGSTKNGTPDIDSIINVTWQRIGIPWKIEIKVGADYQKDSQKEQQADIELAGGKYSVIRSPEEFFELYDSLIA